MPRGDPNFGRQSPCQFAYISAPNDRHDTARALVERASIAEYFAKQELPAASQDGGTGGWNRGLACVDALSCRGFQAESQRHWANGEPPLPRVQPSAQGVISKAPSALHT